MRELVDVHFPDAEVVVVVEDQLSIPRPQPSVKPLRPPKRNASWTDWRFTGLPNMQLTQHGRD